MTSLGKLVQGFGLTIEPLPSFDLEALVADINTLAVTASVDQPLGTMNAIRASVLGWLYQDDDAHETCSLVACLNPLHPGPCKGWKGTLHSVAPGAWKQIESARVEKANAKRVAKIADLKAQGKPIPKKLLAPIVAKPHPNAGKTAAGADGGAHDASKGITQTSGVKVTEAGKIGDGQPPLKLGTDATGAKGPKGKKPTVAGKGIAVVIAQEKVTPQYKLDKAAGITTEQWRGLTADEQNIIRGELAKIQKDGFGPQQKKATDLLDKLNKMPEKAPEKPAAAPGKKTLGQATKSATVATKAGPKTEAELKDKLAEIDAKIAANEAKAKAATPAAGKVSSPAAPKLGSTTPAKPSTTGKTPTSIAKDIQKNGSADILVGGKRVTVGFEGQGKPGKLTMAPGGHYVVTTPDGEKISLAKGEHVTVFTPKPDAVAAPTAKIENATAKPADLPAHVKHAISMANGKALGATWSKNHLAAYEKLTPEQFHALDADTQAKIITDLLAKFGKGPATATTPKTPTPAAHGPADFTADFNNHAVSATEAKKAVDAASPATVNAAAKKIANVAPTEDPDNPSFKNDAPTLAQGLVDHLTKLYDSKVTGSPEVTKAIADFKQAMAAEIHARYVGEAKKKAFNKVTKAIFDDVSPQVTDKLSPIEMAALKRYQKHLLAHPVASDTADIDALALETKKAKADLEAKLQAALKKANAPKPEDMSKAQIQDRVHDLLNHPIGTSGDPTWPDVTISADEKTQAKSVGQKIAQEEAAKFSAAALNDPAVQAKLGEVEKAATKLMSAGLAQSRLKKHLANHHDKATLSGKDVFGNQLTADDIQVINLHANQLKADHEYLNGVKQAAELTAAKAAFTAAAEKAEQLAAAPPPLVELSDYDKNLVSVAYEGAWYKSASKAVTYGVTTFGASQKMKAHPDYPSLTQDLGDLKKLSGKVALAHAEANTAYLNVPTDPDTGNVMVGSPEWSAWQSKIHDQQLVQQQFTAKLNQAQKKLDTIRVDAGLKKRALPKLDAPAVKAAAAEAGFYKTGGYSGPNYGKASAAKNYMLAKLGSTLGVKHMTAADKKDAKTLGSTAPPPTLPPSAPGVPVAVSSGTGIDGIPASLKKTITSDFKAMPTGKYLADPAEDIFGNLVNLAAAHGKNIPGGLSVDQVVKTIDATHASNLGVSNSGMLEKKITDWLATGTGAAYAQAHSTPDAKVVKGLTGEVDLPKGVTLAAGEKVQKVAGPGPHDASIPHDAFKKATSPGAQAAQDKYMQEQGVKWTAKQKAALKAYTGSAYTTFNNYLRGTGSASATQKQQIIDIQSAMIPLTQHTLLKRGTGWSGLPKGFQDAASAKGLIGKTFEEPGFTSTTVGGESGSFGGAVQLEIEAPIGTPAAFVNGVSHYKDKENEMLLAAGTKFQVLSVTENGHQTVLRVRIVGDK